MVLDLTNPFQTQLSPFWALFQFLLEQVSPFEVKPKPRVPFRIAIQDAQPKAPKGDLGSLFVVGRFPEGFN